MGSGFRSPHPVQEYHTYLEAGLPQDEFITFRRAYIRNIAYAFQYLEHISHSLHNEELHAVIKNQVCKTFVITGCSIVESILWILLKSKNENKKSSWKLLRKQETGQFPEQGIPHKFQILQYAKRPTPVDEQMRFFEMCKRAEKKKVLGIASTAYAKINHLRKLRNRVHIHAVQHDRDNDWWTFGTDDVATMKEVLEDILKAGIFAPHARYSTLFGWLAP